MVNDSAIVDELYAADRALFASSDKKDNLRARLKAANKRVSSQLRQMAKPDAVSAIPATAMATESDSPSVPHTLLSFVDNAIKIEMQETASLDSVPLESIEDCAQFRRPMAPSAGVDGGGAELWQQMSGYNKCQAVFDIESNCSSARILMRRSGMLRAARQIKTKSL